MSRPGLYVMVFFCLMQSCSADIQSDTALKILKKQFPTAAKE